MSDAYQINGVTVTPTGGGWYEISHTSLPEPAKVQGKETADAKALEVARAAEEQGPGTLPAQGALDPALVTRQAAQQADPAFVSAQAGGLDPRTQEQIDQAAKDAEELATLRNQRAEDQATITEATRRAELAEAALQTKTVNTTAGAVPSGKIPAGVPRRYEGTLDDKAKAELKKMGLNLVRIVLEENDAIPPTGLFVGHNGRGYMIVPGEEVDVPDFLLNVLNDAVMSAPVVDSKSQKVLGYRNRSRYPYRVITN